MFRERITRGLILVARVDGEATEEEERLIAAYTDTLGSDRAPLRTMQRIVGERLEMSTIDIVRRAPIGKHLKAQFRARRRACGASPRRSRPCEARRTLSWPPGIAPPIAAGITVLVVHNRTNGFRWPVWLIVLVGAACATSLVLFFMPVHRFDHRTLYLLGLSKRNLPWVVRAVAIALPVGAGITALIVRRRAQAAAIAEVEEPTAPPLDSGQPCWS